MYSFCTYFDQNYLSRGLALYASLREHCPAFDLWVLCMDRSSYEILNDVALAGMHLITLEEFEQNDVMLLKAKQNRSRIEYYFTCTPSLPLFIFHNHPEVDLITYLDADLFFFSNPAELFDEMVGKSIGIIGHRFPPRLRHLEKYGIYNVGWLSFRRDENGLECLQWWRGLCLDWCFDYPDDNRFADQKYLDRFPERYGYEIVLQHKGANLAPWNLEKYLLSEKDRIIYVDNQPLIFFHFHAFKQVMPWVYDCGLWAYNVKMSRELSNYIYIPYVRALQQPLLAKLPLKSIRNWRDQETFFTKTKKAIIWCIMFIEGMVRRKYLLIIKGKVIRHWSNTP